MAFLHGLFMERMNPMETGADLKIGVDVILKLAWNFALQCTTKTIIYINMMTVMIKSQLISKTFHP